MTSPFKFLDAYSAADSAAFFGRTEEVAALYDMVMKNRLILVYGQSGTGKTSLIQCGLASRFDTTDWLPISVRRQNDLNASLRQQLAKVSGLAAAASPLEAIREIYLQFLRPVYLVFDQLEELFILGNKKEQDEFAATIKAIQESNTPCRILLVIREEYLAHLYSFERVVPTLFDRRLRVEAMGAAKVTEVLRGSFQRFNISVEAPAETTFEKIIDNISGGKAGVQLPYLQVYLDLLYREDFARTYPEGVAQEEGDWLPVTITRAEVEGLGKIDNVLERFLREQQEQLQALLAKKNPDIDPDAVKKVLDAFVTEEGTKRPVSYSWEGEKLHFDEKVALLFKPLSPAEATVICKGLEQRRLLRFGDAHIELAHDALAQIIDGKRSTEQRRLRDALNRISSAYRENLESGEHLSRRQLNSLEDLKPRLVPLLAQEIKAFLQKSEVRALELEQAELIAERKKRRKTLWVAVLGFILAMMAATGMIVAMEQYRAAARNAADALRSVAAALKVEGKYEEALVKLKEIKQYEGVLSSGEKQKLSLTSQSWEQIKELVADAKRMRESNQLKEAIQRFKDAQQIDGDVYLDNLATQAEKDLETNYNDAMRNGQVQMTSSILLPDAIKSFEAALLLKPGDEAALRRLQECRRKLK